ncbi:hypothetical protein C0Q70_09972 [Pomacea canaliculata]|uniref:Formimidoyltransferase-cyclodeaminase n=1 Tax=Pomacea canaliculata TaxID=400727 RepID=A0A2T7PBB4_POMCA|nr:hypothetical protein C0Q70_09972 [Pomacea canaliculata]
MLQVIEAIANAIAHTDGCSLLDVDPGLSTNRTVYTFVGSPESVLEGAMNAARTAYQLIDMRSHQGEHPRMGAMDVCPFIPVHNTTMEECVEIAHEFGERLAVELGVPVYLYGEAAAEEKRRLLPSVRAGEYEGLVEKLEDPEWKPDFGPSDFIPSWGATAVGARKFLIAYNVNLLGTKEQAHHIALNIREQGKEKPGRLPKVQGMGWYMEEANIAQISMNLVDFEVTGIHTAYEECCNKAEELNLGIIGSQIVGIVPLKALMDAADHFMKKENLFILEEDQKVRLGAALGSMVGFLTYGNRKFHHLDTKMRELIAPLYKAMKDLLPFVDADAAAFSEYMLAVKLPNDTEEERKARETAMQSGLLTAVQVGVRVLETAVWGTYYNVVTNLKDIKDEELRTKMQAEIDEALTTAQQNCTAVLKVLDERKE